MARLGSEDVDLSKVHADGGPEQKAVTRASRPPSPNHPQQPVDSRHLNLFRTRPNAHSPCSSHLPGSRGAARDAAAAAAAAAAESAARQGG